MLRRDLVALYWIAVELSQGVLDVLLHLAPADPLGDAVLAARVVDGLCKLVQACGETVS